MTLSFRIPALAWLALGAAAGSPTAVWAGLPLDPSNFPDLAQLLSTTFANPVLRTVGTLGDHRPYDGASLPLDGMGMEFSLETTLVRVPESFLTALQTVGVTTTLPDSIPVPRAQVRKRFGSHLGAGVSWAQYQGYKIWGGDAKLVLDQPEEGLVWAIRICYATTTLGFAKAQTWSPQIVASKPLMFAETYIGAGAQLVTGSIEFTQTVLGHTFSASQAGSASQFVAFMGVQFKPVNPGFQITVEGAYNSAGLPTLGVRTGVAF